MSQVKQRSLRFLAGVSVTVLMLASTPALAQDKFAPAKENTSTTVREDTSTTAKGDTSTTDIVVTAQKRSERLQDVPIAANVVTNQAITNSGVDTMLQLGTLVPGLNIQHSQGSFIPSIRGISTSSNVVENPVALYIDGVYMANQREGMRDLADIDQITVLKGPQGTLFGRNATAGVIQIATRAPSHNTQGEFKVGFDNYATVKGSAYITGGLSDDIAASFSASYSTQGKGWGRSLSNGDDVYRLKHNISLRGKLLIEPDDLTKISLIADYLDHEDTGRSYQPYSGTNYAYPGYGAVTSRYDTYSTTPSWNRFAGWGLSADIDRDLHFARLVSISSYRKGDGGFRFDFTGVATPYVISTGDLNNSSYIEELQLISPTAGALRWVAGLFYFHNNINYPYFTRKVLAPGQFSLPGILQINSQTSEDTESIAGFVQADYEFAPRTTLTLGGRYTYEKRTLRGFNTTISAANVTTVQNAFTPNDLSISKPTWRVALNHGLTRDVSVYASYNRGIKSGAFNISSPAAAPAREETLDAWETGVKSQFFDRRITLNSSAFFYKYRNLQVQSFVDNSVSPILGNSARAEMYGFDADLHARIDESFTLSGGLQWMHAIFTDYGNAPLSRPRPGGGAIIFKGDATGNRLPFSQKFVGSLAGDFTQPIGDWKARLNITASYNGDYYFEADNFMRQPAYVMLNTSLQLTDASDRMSFTLAATNLLDESIIAQASTQNYAYFVNYGNAPRIVSLTAGLKF